MRKEFSTYRLTQVKDIFVFCCLTGLAYYDVKKINCKNIGTGSDGDKWLMIKRTKTGTGTMIPLLQAALEILGKYQQNSFA